MFKRLLGSKNTPQYIFTRAKILSKYKDSYYVGIRLSKLMEEYWLNIITEDGAETGYQVREDVYQRVEEGQEGTLVTVNGNFFDFGDGENISAMMTGEDDPQE